MSDLFPRAFGLILGHEGGFVNDPQDPGGATNWGITIGTLSSWRGRPATVQDVRELTVAEAQAIYRRGYWDACRCGEMPWPVALPVFDAAVNQGPQRARVVLQMALRVRADGVIGPATMAALAKADPVSVAEEIQAQRVMAYAALPGWGRFGLGWTRRAVRVMAQAVG